MEKGEQPPPRTSSTPGERRSPGGLRRPWRVGWQSARSPGRQAWAYRHRNDDESDILEGHSPCLPELTQSRRPRLQTTAEDGASGRACHGEEQAKAGQARAGGRTGRRGPAVRPSGVRPVGVCGGSCPGDQLAALMLRCQHPHDPWQSPMPTLCTQHLYQTGTLHRPPSWPAVASLIHQACSACLPSH